ncbi:50S ribosomal protein L29 [Patulibacter minatonensis]|jgi:large subunit ribosomal protein L29|uniref:50S ribosomal protein L29 n=1 Tax=Patulibacter minatonensis TaxID=298163 RepID=UPI000479DEE7|nr:50S ribosomal protein L29 [Patulibacter minatonensis]
MRTQELRDLDDQKIVEQITAFRKELFGLRFQQATGELENTAALRATRRELARAITIARQRGIDVENG